MLRIAIVEDEQEAAEHLKALLLRFAEESSLTVEMMEYRNAVSFLTNYAGNFDLIFMDIEMPHMNGLDAAAKLREIDKTTLLIFVTNLGHMAAKGYEVEAFDFIVKPVQAEALKLKMKRVLTRLNQVKTDVVSFTSEGIRYRVPASSVQYVEVRDHQLIYHTAEGNYSTYGTISSLLEQLEPKGFFLCNSCYLVNMRHVHKVQKYTVTVGSDELLISHPRKKAFLMALNNYIGG